MPAFARPEPEYPFDLAEEVSNLNTHFNARHVPEPDQEGKLLMATWNIANLGEQQRSEKDLKLIAHLLKRFDLVAIQEIKQNFLNFVLIVEEMGAHYDYIFSDTAGNNERLGFIYNTRHVKLGKLFAEVAIPERRFPKLTVTVPYTYYREQRVEVFYELKFTPFDRNPFVCSFKSGNLDFMVANVHLYYGAPRNSKTTEDRAKYARRVLEIHTLSKWAQSRISREAHSYDKDIILIGDMNMPDMDPNDDAFKALKRSGLLPTEYYSKTGGSNLNDDKTYDQLAVTKGDLKDRMLDYGVFDFDNGIFKNLWNLLKDEPNPDVKFASYVRGYISDHRPLWVQFDIN